MKYVIKWDTEMGTTHYLAGIPAALREYRGRFRASITHTQTFTRALLYDSWDAASAVIVYVHKAGHPGRIYGITEKDLFKARLQG